MHEAALIVASGGLKIQYVLPLKLITMIERHATRA